MIETSGQVDTAAEVRGCDPAAEHAAVPAVDGGLVLGVPGHSWSRVDRASSTLASQLGPGAPDRRRCGRRRGRPAEPP
jgi:hypothetical protein